MSLPDKTTPAVRKLQLSKLTKRAQNLSMFDKDLDIEAFSLYLSSQLKQNIVGRVVDGNIEMTIEGASTLSITLIDQDRAILTSGLLSDKLDVNIDGIWFRLASVDLDTESDEIIITFEDREIAILREYAGWKVARRSKTTRAEFILNLIREVREFKIPVWIPELHVLQPIERYSGDVAGVDASTSMAKGIAPDINKKKQKASSDFPHGPGGFARTPSTGLTVKGALADEQQIKNANIILGVGETFLKGNPQKRKLQVCAIMTAIQESDLHNIPGGDNAHGGGKWDSSGLFQQTGDWGSYEDRTDPATTARLFYQAAAKVAAADPTAPYWLVCADTQHPRESLRREYANWRTEADRFANAYGILAGSAAEANGMTVNRTGGSTGANYVFWRGKIEDRHGAQIRKPENTWSCIQRLADDVDWRAFFAIGGDGVKRFYYVSEDDLFTQRPIATLKETTDGIIKMTGNYDRNKKSGTVTITAEVGKWSMPPGAIVVIQELGPWNGRWIINDYNRPIFEDVATITLKKPRPSLPEPITDNASNVNTSWFDKPDPADPLPSGQKLINRVLALEGRGITFSRASQRDDIRLAQIDDRVLQFLIWIVENDHRFVTITALKSDHSKYTSEGRLSAHGAGRAVDLGNFNEGNPATRPAMIDIRENQEILGFDQLIGPIPELVVPTGYYDKKTLDEHKSHIHVGWAI